MYLILLAYPNLDYSGGEVLLDNERVIAGRAKVEPAYREDLRSHPSNQIFNHVKGGT